MFHSIAASAIGTVASVAGLGLQGAQHAEYLKQLPEQKKLIALQVRLAQHQLDQYDREQKPLEMLRLPGNIAAAPRVRALPPPMLMSTRSMTRTGTLGAQLMPEEQIHPQPAQAFVNPAFQAVQGVERMMQSPVMVRPIEMQNL